MSKLKIVTMPATTTEIVKAVNAIKSAQTFGLVAHRNPDGDALGSALGLAHVLRAQGKTAVVSWPDPYDETVERYSFLPGIKDFVASAQFPECDVVISCDCASLGRLGELASTFSSAPTQIVIDHHVSNEGFGSINVIDADAAATAIVIRDLVHALEWPLTADAALCLYVGLITDTGRFQHSNTTPRVFALAQELAEFDLPIAQLSRELFEQDSFGALQLTGKLIERAELDQELKFVWSHISDADLTTYNVKKSELEGLVEVLRRTREAEVACFLRDYDGVIEGSLRAVSEVDVSVIAKSFGGGGHRLAAGFSAHEAMSDVIVKIKQQLPTPRK